MANIVILFSGEYPGSSPSAKRLNLYFRGLIESGYRVELYSTYKKTYCKLTYYLNLLITPWIIIRKVLTLSKNSKLFFVYGYGWVSLLLIRLAMSYSKSKFVLEINEKPYSTYGNRLTEIRFVKWFNILMYQNLVLPGADGFVLISENLVNYILRFKAPKAIIIKLAIIIDPKDMHADVPYIQMYKPFLLHAGALSERKDGIIGVFEAFALANKYLDNTLHFYLTDKLAPTAVFQKIQQIIKQNDLENNVHFLGIIPQTDLLAYQKECSMLIINKPDNEQNRYNFPTKLGEYLALGKPVIYTPVGEMTKYLKDGINSFEIPFNSSQSLSDKILTIIQNNSSITPIAEKGKELAANDFHYLFQTRRLALFFQQLTNIFIE